MSGRNSKVPLLLTVKAAFKPEINAREDQEDLSASHDETKFII